MKKYILYVLLIFLNMNFFTACFDDKSTDPDHPIPDIVIDTIGIPGSFKVTQNERLTIRPKVRRDNGDASYLSYKWMLNTVATTTQATGANYSNYVCIGESEVLDTIIFLAPNEITYFLWFQVTDNKTQYRRDILWKVLVQSAYNEGILIANTKDGRTTDFSLIEGQQFTEGWTGADKITHNLYSNANGNTMDGLVKQICHSYNSVIKSKRFYCIGNDFYTLVDGLEYKLVGRDFEVIYDNTLSMKPEQIFFSSTGYIVWVNDGNMYPFNKGIARDYPNIQIPMGYAVQEGETQKIKTSKIDKYVAYTHQSGNSKSAWGVWYDKAEGRFLCQKGYPYVKKSIETFVSDPQKAFDPNNLPGLETVYAAIGVNGDFYMIMKNTTTGVYQVYVIERTTSSAKYLYNIPGNEMDQAMGYVVSEDGNVIYFATSTQIYAIVLGGVSPQVNLLYTISSGEITHFSMFRQAWYLINPMTYVSGAGYKVPIDTHENLLLTGVWDGNNGTLYTIPIVSASGGSIDQNNIKTYSGFGKILTVVSQQ